VGGLTFDTGMLIALERRKQRAARIFSVATDAGVRITVPVAAVGEWWRGRTDAREEILASVDVEPMSLSLAKLAGEAIARVRGATLVDAVVMASAALRGDTVYTSDFEDLVKLQAFFTSVRVLST
jgi:predicted nucleic acid-binding protein